jgi:hypothetical protein
MTKRTLLTTASAAVLAMAIASPVMADPNDFANSGNGSVGILNLTLGGSGGSGGDGGDATGPAVSSGGNGGAGAVGGVGGVIINNINANSGNTYNRKEVKVHASNHQTATSGGGYGPMDHTETLQFIGYGATIDTSGGSNRQSGGSASASGSAGAAALNLNFTDVSGGTATGGSASATNDADTTAHGGYVVDAPNLLDDGNAGGSASGDASAHAKGNSAPQGATVAGGQANGGNGGDSTNDNDTMGGQALAAANGGNTSGPQNANGGPVNSGVMTVDGMGSAAGAFAMNAASGAFGVGNSANAVAAHVDSITTN